MRITGYGINPLAPDSLADELDNTYQIDEIDVYVADGAFPFFSIDLTTSYGADVREYVLLCDNVFNVEVSE